MCVSNGTDKHRGWGPSLVHFMLNLVLTLDCLGLWVGGRNVACSWLSVCSIGYGRCGDYFPIMPGSNTPPPSQELAIWLWGPEIIQFLNELSFRSFKAKTDKWVRLPCFMAVSITHQHWPLRCLQKRKWSFYWINLSQIQAHYLRAQGRELPNFIHIHRKSICIVCRSFVCNPWSHQVKHQSQLWPCTL